MILVVGSTGLLGGEICRQLRLKDQPVRALVRPTSDAQRVEALRGSHVEVATGDLKDPSSLEVACAGVEVVVSTASAMMSRVPGDSLTSVDLEGQLSLLRAAEAARVRRFVLLSFPDQPFVYPLQTAKRAVEVELSRSPVASTVLRPTFFTEVWLGPALWPFHGLHPGESRARFVGAGAGRTNWISFVDVAEIAARAAVEETQGHRTVDLAGPDALSWREIGSLYQSRSGRALAMESVPEEAIRQQMTTASTPVEKSVAALMLAGATGDPPSFATTPSQSLRGSRRVVDHLDRLAHPL